MDFIKKLGPIGNIEFDKLFLVELLSHFSDAIVQFLLVFVLLGFSNTPGSSIAIMFFCFLLPQFLLSPLFGVLTDRLDRKKILSISSIYRSFVVLILLFLLPKLSIGLVYFFAVILGLGAALFYPCKMAIITNIIKSMELKYANAIVSSIGATALLFGALGANYLIKFGLKTAFITICLTYLSAGIIALLIKLRIPQKYLISKVNGIKTAFNYLKNHKRALYLVFLSIALQFIVAVFSNSLNSLITDYLGLNFSDLTYLRTLLGIGVVLGMILSIYFSRLVKIPHLFAVSFCVLCIVLLTAPMCHSLTTAWLWLIPIGVADAIILVLLDTILQKVTPDRVRGKVFGFQLTLSTLSFLIGTIIASSISSFINPLITFKAIALLSLVLASLILIFDKSFRYFLLKATLGQIFLMLFNYKVEGIENIPKKGKIILAGNHTGHLDPFIIQMATHRQLWFITGPAAFKTPIVRHFLKYFNVLPLKFGKGLEALDSAINKLNQGEAVLIFPEGKFTKDGSLSKFNRGVGIISKKTQTPIIPFAIKGGFETWGQTRKTPKLFNTIVIQFGEAIKEFDCEEKEIAKNLQVQVNFLKKALDRRAFYNINQKLHSNFLELMQEKGDIYAQNTALIKGSEKISYIELSKRAKEFANYLIEAKGADRGQKIAILTESNLEFAVAMFGCIQTGAIVVPLDNKLTLNEHTNILNDCKPRFLLCSRQFFNHGAEIKKNVSSIEELFVLEDIKNLKGDINKDLGKNRSLNETALIVYTSGTTGNPKGVMISFGNIYSQLRDFEVMFKLSNKNTLLSILPLNHLLELNCGFFGMLYMGAKIVYLDSLTPKELIYTLKKQKITNMIVVPLVAKMLKSSIEKQIRKQSKFIQRIFNIEFIIAKLLPRKLKRVLFKPIIDALGGNLECFISGGAPLEEEVAVFFDRIGIPVFQGYGLTETSPTIATNRYGKEKIGTVGVSLPSVNVRIDKNGEIIVTGPNIMQGYYNKPDLTREVIDEFGWFKTGDIGRIDKQGFITITGRIKNLIVLQGGKKIFPEEVEAVLQKSSLIKEVCVLALNKNNKEEVGAIIVPADELNKKTKEQVNKELEIEVKELSKKYLAHYKNPTIIVVYKNSELPKTSTRKIKRNELKDWYNSL